MPCLHFIHTEKFTEILSKVYFSLHVLKLKDSLPYVKLLVEKQRIYIPYHLHLKMFTFYSCL